jgi:hypothetical protein
VVTDGVALGMTRGVSTFEGSMSLLAVSKLRVGAVLVPYFLVFSGFVMLAVAFAATV